jgi:hopanoid biosynthesis associated RND transporter like protein HpnN
VSIRTRFFRALAKLTVEHPYMVLGIAFALSVLSIFYTKARLEFRTGQDDLISGDSRDVRNYQRYSKEFPDLDGVIIVVAADGEPARAEMFTDALAKKLLADKINVKSVFYRIDTDAFADSALLFLSPDELKGLAKQIDEHREFLATYANNPSLATFFSLVNGETNRAMTSEMMSGLLGPEPEAPAKSQSKFDLTMLNGVLNGMLAPSGTRFISPWGSMTGAGEQSGFLRDGYLATENGKYLLLNVAPADGVKDGPDPVDVIEDDIGEVRAQFPGLDAGMTGGPALAHAEENATTHDVKLASMLAVGSNAALVIIPFAAIVEPIFALIALLVGVAWSFGFTTLAVGHLNLLSAVFTSILAGIGVNFPIHLMARYNEARREGAPVPLAIELAVANTGAGVVASAIIMALAFLMPMFTDFKGIAELGLISAAGLFMCMISAMLVFPAMVAIRDRNRPLKPHLVTTPASGSASKLDGFFKRPKLILISATALTLALFAFAPRVRFDQNLLKLQAQDSEAVRFENALLKDSGRSSWFAVSLAQSAEQAEQLAAKFKALPQVSNVETIATYIPAAQTEKRAILSSIQPNIIPIAIKPARADATMLARELDSLRFKLGSAQQSDSSGEVAKTAALLGRASAALQKNPNVFDDYDRAMAADLASKLEHLRRALSPAEVTAKNLPAILRDRFIGSSGAYLVQVYPRGDVWDDAPLANFVSALRGVDPDVTGPPIQTYSIATVMRRGYERAATLALLAVFIFVFADFRNLRDTALATVPLLFGGAWLLETMGVLGWEFNLANLFAVPIIIGTGVDNGVNMLYRWREEREKSQLILTRAVGKSVTICSLTTIAGFAALIPASHHGISTLGLVLSIGVTLILIATVLVLPALLKVIGTDLDAPAQAPGAPSGAEQNSIAEEKPRRIASGALKMVPRILGAAAGALFLTAALSVAYAAGDSRARSDEIVKEAETTIMAAGKQKPLDAAMVNRAIDELHQALKIDPRNDSAYVDLGFCYGLLREGSTAEDMYRTATLINPSAANFKELADVYLRTGNPEAALMAANAGLQKEPHNAKLYNAKGLALNDLKRFDESERAFREAVRYDPSLEVARQNLEAISGPAGKAAKNRQ